jgi:prepilin-type N-terminal cleavage/methylation domain-containing protein
VSGQPRLASSGQRGFSLAELMMGMAILVPLLASIVGTHQMLTKDLSASDAAATAAETCRIAGQRMTNLARAGCLSTCVTRATQADVDAAIAAQLLDPSVVVPALGAWISFPQDSARPTLRFQAADGVLSLNASALTPPREFEFQLDAGEADNDADDDGDGLVDEGSVVLRGGAQLLHTSTGVEGCTFKLSGRVLIFELRCARRGADGRIFRSNSVQEIYMRNI